MSAKYVIYFCWLQKIISAQYFENIEIHIYKDGSSTSMKLIDADSIYPHPDVTEITIEEQRLHTLRKGTFRNLTKLRRITIKNTELNTIEEGALLNLPKLHILNFNFNQFKKIPEGVFKNLQMSKLYLQGNGIEDIDQGAFNYLQFLEILDLSRNKIKKLHQNMFVGSAALKEINLSFNQIEQIPNKFFEEAFSYDRHIEHGKIDLSHNKIFYINSQTFKGVLNLEELYLNNNNIENIDANSFKGMNIKNLANFEGNQLRSLSSQILKDLIECNEINIFANPWNCNFVRKYMKWVKENEKEDSIDLNLLKECFPVD